VDFHRRRHEFTIPFDRRVFAPVIKFAKQSKQNPTANPVTKGTILNAPSPGDVYQEQASELELYHDNSIATTAAIFSLLTVG
jgi:hypothetical protein